MPPCPHCGVTQAVGVGRCQFCGASLLAVNLRRILLWVAIVGVALAVLLWFLRLSRG
jgi:hypothetical protein